MGLLARTVTALSTMIPERKVAVGAAINTWESGVPQQQKESYYRYALEGYSGNEVAFACVEELASSAGEPRLVAVRKTDKGPEQLHEHPVLELLEHPNPWISGSQLISTLIMYRAVSGNAYIEKVRSGAGKIVELFALRPDRMWVVPDANPNIHLRGWEYKIGADTYFLPARDVIQTKTRNPLDDWYGMPPMRPAALRIDSAAAMRVLTQAFFNNAGIPAGLLTLEKQVGPAEAQMIRDRARNDYGGRNAFNMMVLAGQGTVTYTPMGMPLGERGLVMPELDEILDAKTAMVFGVPLELIGARLGMIHGNRSTTKEARASFWDETLVPLYRELAADLTRGLRDEYGDFDYLEFDLSTVQALQEDENQKSERVIKQLHAGLISVQEGRVDLGREPEFEAGAILVMPDNISGLPADQLDAPPEPAPMALGAPGQNGSLTPREREVLGA